ncbi:alpha/beta hydrolase [Estrella lausannensis]|uniref:Peptidase S9 prolyl oligopeptidase catalytic domain-containing protein n=1 Tax=Estrella lausannensis TaxID=483423 RepID=A0A0H5DP67_9BACT|nr:alpha/beta fold hydrolase [Estrella lausannensis]CRX38162.1 Conserved hypothetical protein [Estrella lausannensis]
MHQEQRESITLEIKGMKLFGLLHTPVNLSNAPCVFFCHGLAGNKIGKDRVYVEIASKLCREGIASFRMDFRGSGDSDGAFSEMLPEYYVEDALAALNFLTTRKGIDPDRLGIMARSFGGPVAVEAAAQHKRIKSLTLWCPMFSGEQWRDHWQLLLSHSVDAKKAGEMMRINGQQGSTEFFERFMRISVENPLKELSSIPLLHIHGEEDTKVTMQHAHDYERIRKGASAPSRFIRLPKTDHDFSHFDEKQRSIDETIQWFKETLK